MVKFSKGNIPIDKEIFGKYNSVHEIFENEEVKEYIIMDSKIPKLNEVDFKKKRVEYIKRLANNIFNKYHSNNTFVNNENKITIGKKG